MTTAAHDRRERVFATPPPGAGRDFATGRWGRAWLKALEDSALDGKQVKAGRRYARAGAVGAVSVRPGRITALVQDRDGVPYRADVVVQRFTEADWDRFLDVVADRPEHLAALLDGELPPHLAEDAAAAGVDLLPGIGDLEAECACGAWDHCPHSTALCHQVAGLLDRDPLVLLLLRGRGEGELLEELRARSAPRAAEHAPEPPAGIPAREAFAGRGLVPPLPDPPPPVDVAGRPPVLAGEGDGAEEAHGLDVEALAFLAREAAVRARRLLAEALAPGHELTPVPGEPTVREDAERLVAAGAPERVAARLAARLAEAG